MSVRTNRIIPLLIAAFVLLTTAPTFAGNIIYVDDDGPADFNNIQAAIDDAHDGDIIIVADGTYTGQGNRDIDFLGKAITVRSENGAENCIIDCNGTEAEPHRGFYFHSGEDANSVLQGFTITNGIASEGAAIYCSQSSPKLINCVLRGNKGTNDDSGGGAMYNDYSNPTVTNCTFIENEAYPSAASGGAIHNNASSPTMTNCKFLNNKTYGGGAIFNNNNSNPVLTNCTFTGNTASLGGGVSNCGSTATLEYCTFTGNSAFYGGGMQNNYGSAKLTNCTFSGNSADEHGGGMYNKHSYTILTNCSFGGNSAHNGNALACDSDLQRYPSNVQVTNCIIWDGDNPIWNNDGSTISITYSDVHGDWLGEGNIDADPLFRDPDGNDDIPGTKDDNLRLSPGSPCIDTGDPDYVSGPNETDLDGNPRVICGRIDMGAYEFQGLRLLFVDDDATGKNDGRSWADAYNYLQDALAACCSGDEIRVAQGIYTPDSNSVNPNGSEDRTATFQLINGVTIKGGYAGLSRPDPNARHIDKYETILSGDLNRDDADVSHPEDLLYDPSRDDNSYHVVTGSGTNRTVVLNGFTITGGKADEGWPGTHRYGGGLYIMSGSPTVRNCRFIANTALSYGGGVHMDGNSVPVLVNCRFSGNSATDGGGLNSDYSSPTLTGCTFRGNAACSYNADGGCGGGLYNFESHSRITNCIFTGNSTDEWGGAGGLRNKHSSVVITNCTFANNWGGAGGGLVNSWSDLVLANCTFCGNSALYEAGGVYNNGPGNVNISNCILWGNTPTEMTGGPRDVSYSNVLGGWTGQGNIDVAPLFVDAGKEDYHLLEDSPCIDSGDPNYVAEPNETDLDGKPRVLDGNNDAIAVVDMGAYEYGPSVPAEVKIVPHTINLASKGNWINCYIWLPDKYDVADIEPNSIFLEDEIQPEQFSVDQQKQVATATFDREKVQSILNVGDIELTITCKLNDGTVFEATDIIKVTDKASQKAGK